MIANDQSDIDSDGIGNACDDDIDGDGYLNSYELTYGTLPADPDTDNDFVSDGPRDPDGTGPIVAGPDPTPLGSFYKVEFTAKDSTGADVTGTWLPEDGNSVTVEVRLKDIRTNSYINFSGNVLFALITTSLPGIATNDTDDPGLPSTNDYSFNAINRSVTAATVYAGGSPLSTASVNLYSFDYGGQAVVRITSAAPDGTSVQGDLTLPLDSDRDSLPDAWEKQHSADGFQFDNPFSFGSGLDDGLKDIDTTQSNTLIGDGLSNFKEYRGIIFENTDSNCNVTGTYHQRLNPEHKDLFVRGDNYANSCPPNTAPDVLEFRTDITGGNAYEKAGIDMHDVTRMPSFGKLLDSQGNIVEPPNIDILIVTNNTTDTSTLMGYSNGYIVHLASRLWAWSTKGASYIGNGMHYHFNPYSGKSESAYTYHLNLMHYVYNRPYRDESLNPLNPSYVGLLDPIDLVEDKRRENGKGPEILPYMNPYTGAVTTLSEDSLIVNDVLDGDHMMTGWKPACTSVCNDYSVGYDFSVFDADGDGHVENPPVDDALLISKEYTPLELQTFTILHEIGHALGINGHTSDPKCLMYTYSNNWDRAGFLSDFALGQIMINNKSEP
ncbi:MAG: hypothetical protein C4538_10340 [Nitrospiraceae bacterium]|nr:MAG: hypothetical protein C4538_10340 [Nitrospiraceae bacterium]